ncbi:hypothetical protein N9L76_03090 [bacterium]|nr:hypothetical protein [bacterium]
MFDPPSLARGRIERVWDAHHETTRCLLFTERDTSLDATAVGTTPRRRRDARRRAEKASEETRGVAARMMYRQTTARTRLWARDVGDGEQKKTGIRCCFPRFAETFIVMLAIAGGAPPSGVRDGRDGERRRVGRD